MPTAVEKIVRRFRIQSLASETDRELLRAFADDGNEAAFAEIVRRHGPLVLGVCRRVLGNADDADDAFQATFLVLARKAASVPWRDTIKNWLHGVACRVAMKARGRALRRREKEKLAASQQPVAVPVEAWNELRSVLDDEIELLPAKYRDVLILCYLEGKTRDEAAEQLGWSLGSVKGCLERGRELLRTRLCKRGLTLSAALSAGLLCDATAGAGTVPAVLQAMTVQSAFHFVAGSASHAALAGPVLQLAQGALNAMLIAKLKTIGTITLLFAFGTTAFWGAYQTNAGGGVELTSSARAQDAPRRAVDQEGVRGKDGNKKSDFLGLIKAIDLKVGTLTATSLRDGEGGGDSTFSLASKDLKVVSTMGVALKLSDLTVGTRVQLDLKDTDVLAIHVEHPTVPAFLNSVDAAKRTIEARAERKIGQYEVAADAKITIKGKAIALKDAPLDERVFLTLSLDRKIVLAMNYNNKERRDGDKPGPEKGKGDRPAEKPKDGDRRVDAPNAGNATIVDVDAGKNTLNVLVGRGEDLALQSLTVAKDLKIKVMFGERVIQEIPLAELTKPLQATVQLSDDKKSVVALTVFAPSVRGGFKSIDASGKKITVVAGEREEKTYDLDAMASIRMPGRDVAGIADLKAGTSVIIGLSLDRQRVIGITVLQPTRREGDRE